MAHGDDLERKPLVEAIFELRWKLTGTPGSLVDPNYKLLVGSLYGAMRDEYPHHEQLPAATVPDEFVPYLIQHRFRRSDGGYPLVQVGPGIFAVNETTNYSWRAYLPRILAAVGSLRETYAAGTATDELVPTQMTLRYINAVPFDFRSEDVLTYLADNLKVTIAYPNHLFTEPGARRPDTIILQSTHGLANPAGVGLLKFATGESNGVLSLLWETQIQSSEAEVPTLDGLEPWVEQAHEVARAWFFTLIEGKLEAEFNS